MVVPVPVGVVAAVVEPFRSHGLKREKLNYLRARGATNTAINAVRVRKVCVVTASWVSWFIPSSMLSNAATLILDAFAGVLKSVIQNLLFLLMYVFASDITCS